MSFAYIPIDSNPNDDTTKSLNHVSYNGENLIDLSEDSVSSEKLMNGYSAHNKSGNEVTGVLEPIDLSDVTVTENNLNSGETAINSDGVQITGEYIPPVEFDLDGVNTEITDVVSGIKTLNSSGEIITGTYTDPDLSFVTVTEKEVMYGYKSINKNFEIFDGVMNAPYDDLSQYFLKATPFSITKSKYKGVTIPGTHITICSTNYSASSLYYTCYYGTTLTRSQRTISAIDGLASSQYWPGDIDYQSTNDIVCVTNRNNTTDTSYNSGIVFLVHVRFTTNYIYYLCGKSVNTRSYIDSSFRPDIVGCSPTTALYGTKLGSYNKVLRVECSNVTDSSFTTSVTVKIIPFTSKVYSIVYGNGTFLIGGEDYYCYSKDDGKTFTMGSPPFTIKHAYFSFAGEYFFYTEYNVSTPYRSRDGISWEPITRPLYVWMTSVAYTSTGWYIFVNDYDSRVLMTKDFIHYHVQLLDNRSRSTKDWIAVCYGNNGTVHIYNNKDSTDNDQPLWESIGRLGPNMQVIP